MDITTNQITNAPVLQLKEAWEFLLPYILLIITQTAG